MPLIVCCCLKEKQTDADGEGTIFCFTLIEVIVSVDVSFSMLEYPSVALDERIVKGLAEEEEEISLPREIERYSCGRNQEWYELDHGDDECARMWAVEISF